MPPVARPRIAALTEISVLESLGQRPLSAGNRKVTAEGLTLPIAFL
jgi:hypothetical protein